MKKIIAILLALTLSVSLAAVFASCSGDKTEPTKTPAAETATAETSAATAEPEKKVTLKDNATIAIPNDTTNEARALLLLEDLGLIELDGTKGLVATVNDVTKNPQNFKFVEVDAAQIPNKLADVNYAVINTNFALDAGLNPQVDSLAVEGAASAYANILSVKAGNENTPKTLALKAALESQAVADYITATYGGAVVSVVENPGNGYDASVNYEELNGTTIKVSATPSPHAEVLEIAKTILAEKGITLEIITTTDYAVPNVVTEDGSVDANYFQHVPYMDSFNEEKGTHIVSVAKIHVEPMALYQGGKTTTD